MPEFHRVYLQEKLAPFVNHTTGETEMLMEHPAEYLEADVEVLAAKYGFQEGESERDLILRLQDKPEVRRAAV